MKKKKCPYCVSYFIPNPKVGDRQKTCGNHTCQKELKRENNKRWRRENTDYFKNEYPRFQEWLHKYPDYLKQYREEHPEYVKKTGKIRG